MAVVARLAHSQGGQVTFNPLVMGAPWLHPLNGQADPLNGAEWFSHEFFEHFVEDIDEFSAVAAVEDPGDSSVMRDVSEAAFKQVIVELLGDQAKKDWGGEQSDHFSSHIHLKGRRTTAAFLLKGPAHFSEMKLNHLGKNNDQIARLAAEPAQLLVVQHCHDISSPVRATLRAFAVQPALPRRYCLIDGRDSLRILLAYDKLDYALTLSRSGKTP